MSEPQSSKSLMKPLTLIVAATTRDMGIGRGGALPWPMLKQEMAYFARVTKRTTVKRNAVIMGRKTWESIPPRFRPLRERLNVVLSRTPSSIDVAPDFKENVMVEQSLEKALARLDGMQPNELGHLFVIGGGSIYEEALQKHADRATQVLLTRVKTNFDCDTHFPIDLDVDDARQKGWERCTGKELDDLVGEAVESGTKHEAGVDYEFTLYQRRRKQ